MAYIYLHRRNDTGEVFYVGKGTSNRATTTRGRNEHWNRVVNKAGYSVEIIAKGLTDAEAFWAEPLLIEAHGGIENLTNLSDGGEGFSSEESKALWQDPAHREKISNASKEMWQDPAHREKVSKKISEARKEMWQDPEYREKISKASKEMWQDPAYREKQSKALKEAMQDPAYRERISKARQDPAFREKQSKATKEQWQDPEYREKVTRKVECDKCGRMIGVTRLPQHQRGSKCK